MAATGMTSRMGTRLADILFPPLCLSCQGAVSAQGYLCAVCWERLTFLGPPLCRICGVPFEVDPGGGEEAQCAACIAKPPRYGRARSVLAYDEHSRGLVLRFKHGDRHEGVPAFAQWMARAGRELVAEADLLAPVPLHWRRLFIRRFNQAAILALRLSKQTGVPCDPMLMRRVRATPSQGGLSADARRRNVSGAFGLRGGRDGTVTGRRVLLIDDVFTTGATADACALALHRAGAEAVDVLTLARVVRPRL